MLPALRMMNSSPGSVWVNRDGSIRESEQVINNANGFCPSTSLSNNRCFGTKDVLLELMDAFNELLHFISFLEVSEFEQ